MDHLKAPLKLSQVLNELKAENISKFTHFTNATVLYYQSTCYDNRWCNQNLLRQNINTNTFIMQTHVVH